MEANGNARKAISKTLRFEVFKRDGFRCQYCGATAPDVLLEVDHIMPVAKGGTNDITNLVTSCSSCNSGKRDRLLDDNTTVAKSRKQMEDLQERREQLEMMMNWKEGLRDVQRNTVDRVCTYWHDLARGFSCNAHGRAQVAKWLRRFSVEEVCQAMDIAAEQYLSFQENGNATSDSWEAAFEKIPGICKVNQISEQDPDIKDVYYIRGIVRNRLQGRYYDDAKCLEWLQIARSWSVPINELRRFAQRATSWSRFTSDVCDAIDAKKTGGQPGPAPADA